VNGPLRLAASLAFAAAVAACSSNGSTPTLPAAGGQTADTTHQVWQMDATHTAHAACPGARGGGLFQCDLLIYDTPVGMSPDAISGLTPADFQQAYKLPSATKGKGQIVAIVDAYDNPNVASDLATYRTEFNLGTANFTKYNQKGQQKDYPVGNAGWGGEIDLDVEMVSASCPNCTIYLIEANNNNGSNLYTAEKEAAKLGATIISNSWGGGAGSASGGSFDVSGVAYLASAGDGGYGMQDPADYDTVVSVGGTNLNPNGGGWKEAVWVHSGGGCSVVTKPSWQSDPLCSKRTGNDIAAVANNVALYDTYPSGGWGLVGGTSVSSPLMAGALALAGNQAMIYGGKTFWELSAKAHAKDFNTNIAGTVEKCPSNYTGTYVCTAGLTGSKAYGTYSSPTGWGSPKGVKGF
jgi:subtilase family serine protease